MLIVAPANISLLTDVFAWFIVPCSCKLQLDFLGHFPHVWDPPEPQR
jgi:hypothetical protein